MQGGGRKEKPQEKISEESIIGGQPVGEKPPPRSPTIQTPRREPPSPVFHTPPEVTPPQSVPGPVSQPVSIQTPRGPVRTVSKRLELQSRSPPTAEPVLSPAKPVYHQLRDFNKPGRLERPVDVNAPRMTRSGRSYTGHK